MAKKIPEDIARTMDKAILYNGFRNTPIMAGTSICHGGFYHPTMDCLSEISGMRLFQQTALAWSAIENAHDFWRMRAETMDMFLNEDYANYLNVFARLELAGPAVFNVWAKHFREMFEEGFPFDLYFDKDGYNSQLEEMETFTPEHSPFLCNIFVVKRRKYAENEKIADKGDLYRHVSDMKNDVLGVVRGVGHLGTSDKVVANEISRRMYYDPRGSLSFRLARQIILANGGVAPINW